MIRVWFNHWFSTSYRLIELMKENKGEQVWVIGTNKQYHSVIRNVCDEWYDEPDTDGDAYVEDCIRFCLEHGIDVFVPRRKMPDISRNLDRFREIGVRVMAEEYPRLAPLADKACTYELFRTQEKLSIPEYHIVNTAEEFEQAYEKLKSKYNQICAKFVLDEGGMSFRKIFEEADPCHMLKTYPGNSVPLQLYLEWLRAAEPFDALMVMPYLSGQEISVDCLNTPSGLIAIPRYKSDARHEEIIYDDRILDMVNCVMKTAGLELPCNIQFKLEGDEPYLLEINTRMSGGLQMGCLATGVNIPNIAMNKLLGRDIPWSLERKNRIVSYIEMPELIL